MQLMKGGSDRHVMMFDNFDGWLFLGHDGKSFVFNSVSLLFSFFPLRKMKRSLNRKLSKGSLTICWARTRAFCSMCFFCSLPRFCRSNFRLWKPSK
jgi:hypothetical protein